MDIRALIFDIGGTVFDWNSAIVNALDQCASVRTAHRLDHKAFALACRAAFLALNGTVMRGEREWLTSDEILLEAINRASEAFGLAGLSEEDRRRLATSWRRMPAWPGARAAIAALRQHYVVAPLTILSWPMANGSSRLNGIDWDSILSCDILGIYKPDPRCYARCAEIVACAAENMMMVASHPSDLRAAMASGYRSAYVLPRLEDPGDDYADTGFRTEFDIVAADFEDLTRQLT
jgi:2-haloacid dehalogenase